jgi:hypothetical protein
MDGITYNTPDILSGAKPQLLELFCGTKSISKTFSKAGFGTTTIDVRSSFYPTYCVDVLSIDENFFEKKYDVIWASVPCESFSVCRIGENWHYDGRPKSYNAIIGLRLLAKTIAIIQHIQPKVFFIENPVGKMRSMPHLQRYNRNTITYCQYGDNKMKPTDIWTNSNWKPKRKPCKAGDSCHDACPRGTRNKGVQGMANSKTRAVIPPLFCNEITEFALQVVNHRLVFPV